MSISTRSPASDNMEPAGMAPMTMPVEHWEHVLSSGENYIRGFGHSPETAFVQSALAMTALVTDPARIDPYRLIQLDLRGVDLTHLFADWIGAVSEYMSAQRLLFSAFDVTISGHHLHSCLWGEPFDSARHQPSPILSDLRPNQFAVSRAASGIWIAEYRIRDPDSQ